MADSQASTVADLSANEAECLNTGIPDMRALPAILVLPTHLSSDERYEKEVQLAKLGATITSDISEAQIIIAALSTARRVKFELESRHLKLEASQTNAITNTQHVQNIGHTQAPPRKRLRIFEEDDLGSPSDASTITESILSDEEPTHQLSQLSFNATLENTGKGKSASPTVIWDPDWPRNHVKVVKLDWLKDSICASELLALDTYTIYEGNRISDQKEAAFPLPQNHMFLQQTSKSQALSQLLAEGMPLQRAQSTPVEVERSSQEADSPTTGGAKRRRGQTGAVQSNGYWSRPGKRRPALLQKTTSDEEGAASVNLPPMPDWVKQNKKYACERSTPAHSPNESFIKLLEKIKRGRVLIGDEIGGRAYGTSIASVAAYPYHLASALEILALPGCDKKIAELFREYQTTGEIEAAQEIEKSPALSVINQFYSIHGIGWKTANEFYYERGWRSIDDIVEHGWDILSREQQIGLKFHEEFEHKMHRSEVEYIASIVTYHARRLVDEGIESIIVGGYRRGKTESGDADIILSHRDEAKTHHLIPPLVDALETSGWITHILKLTETNSGRDQQPPGIQGDGQKGSGFDTLDKALLVWQDPIWPTKSADLVEEPAAKNPNIHRRVDIIISPWKTVGCAVTGWTSGTTFQRDLRRYAKYKKKWKFDSSGVRDRITGRWIDLEKWSDESTRAKTWQQAERRVFDGLGLEWREPTERCTG